MWQGRGCGRGGGWRAPAVALGALHVVVELALVLRRPRELGEGFLLELGGFVLELLEYLPCDNQVQSSAIKCNQVQSSAIKSSSSTCRVARGRRLRLVRRGWVGGSGSGGGREAPPRWQSERRRPEAPPAHLLTRDAALALLSEEAAEALLAEAHVCVRVTHRRRTIVARAAGDDDLAARAAEHRERVGQVGVEALRAHDLALRGSQPAASTPGWRARLSRLGGSSRRRKGGAATAPHDGRIIQCGSAFGASREEAQSMQSVAISGNQWQSVAISWRQGGGTAARHAAART